MRILGPVVQGVWDALSEKYFHNRVFKSIDALEDTCWQH